MNILLFKKEPKDAAHIYWMFSIVFKASLTLKRDQIMQLMGSKGIEMRPLFYPIYKMPPYFDGSMHHENAEKIAYSGINLPTHVLLDENDIKYVVKSLKDCIQNVI